MHTGFPEKVLEKYASILIDLGYKIAVVEQLENPKQMKERISNEGRGTTKTLNRDVV